MERNTRPITSFSKETYEQNATKFDCKVSKEEIAFLDTSICINGNKNIQTTVYRKEIDCQSFLYSKSEHPFISKGEHTIYKVRLKTKRICSTVREFRKESRN